MVNHQLTENDNSTSIIVFEEMVSNLDTDAESCKKLIANLMSELCQKDKEARNNGRPTDFALDEIYHMKAFDDAFKQKCIQDFQAKTGFVNLANGRIRLTQPGIDNCNQYH
jgi:hypothetical protein